MLVKIEEIQENGLQRTEAISQTVLTETLRDSNGFALVKATPLSASFFKVSGQVHVKGAFSTCVMAPCKRCNTEVTTDVPVAFSLRMVTEKPQVIEVEEDDRAPNSRRRNKKQHDEEEFDEEELQADADEIDAELFDGKTIDLDPIVREQVLLALPVTVLCRDDCKGLCGVCGEDLNQRDCGHSGQKMTDPRFAKLSEIKLKN